MNHVQPQDGSVKFDCHLTKEKIVIPPGLFNPLNFWRSELWLKSLIGAYPDGIGYGNISVRLPQSDQFYISGTATGGIPELDQIHYPLVEKCSLQRNKVWCHGLISASAESMSHAAVYAADKEIGAVVHIHNRPLWEKYLNILPTTDIKVEYGTPEMGYEIVRIMSLETTRNKKVFVMGGHEEGIISFGRNVEEAVRIILNLQEK